MKNLAKWIRHNQGVFLAVIICIGLLVWTIGCESKVTSSIDPTRMVTAAELNLEIEAESMRLQSELEQLIKRAELKHVELARQDAIKQKLLDFALLTSEAGAFNMSGLIGLVAGVVGIGAVVDNRIKDKVIQNRPLPMEKRGNREEGRGTNNGRDS